MSLREALSTNLTRLCEREKSIAAVCRAAQINRQQFNRYLSGESLPNRSTLVRICRYFRIDEEDLFREPRPNGENVKEPVGDDVSWSHADLGAALKLIHSEVRTSIAPGIYFAYFAIPGDQSTIMRSAMIVRNDGNLSTFRRLTGLAEPKGSWWSNFHGDHKGVIVERRHWLYFLGLNQRGNRDPTLLVMRWLTTSQPMLGGHASILTPPGPSITAVVVHPCPPAMKLSAAVRSAHVYSVDDPNIDTIVMDALDQQCKTLVGMTNPPDLSVKPLTQV